MKEKTFYQKTAILSLIAMLLISFGLSIYSSSKLIGWESVCIAKQCNEWAIGDEWISENCRPKEINGETILNCDVVVDGQLYNIPLSEIKEKVNISGLKSCKKDGMICIKEVYIKEARK